AIAGRARDFQFAARKHEFGDGGTRGWADPVHAGCARSDGEPRGGEIFGGAGFEFLGAARDGYFSAGAPAARGAAPGGGRTARGGFGDGGGNTGREGERMGALITLRDLDSLESINTQLQVSERLAAVGRITAGVAHEVKNPLNSMRLWLENLKESLPAETDGAAQQAVHVLDAEIDRLDAVVKRFLDFSRPMDVRLEPTQLADLLKEVLEVARPELELTNVQVAQLIPIGIPEVFVDRALLKQAILNLVLNAVEAMPNGGQLQLTLSRRGDMAEIT